jgi:hypothetical protein
MMGHLVNGDQEQAFTLLKKRPDKLLFTIESASHEMTFGVSDDIVWQRIRAPEHADFFALIEGPEAEAWLGQRRFFDAIITASLGEGHITEIKVANWEETDCLQVTIQDTNGAVAEILVAPHTMYPIAESRTLPDGTIKQTVFSDYRDVEGMQVPFKMEVSHDGKIASLILLDSAYINSGVLSKLFEIPKDLQEK